MKTYTAIYRFLAYVAGDSQPWIYYETTRAEALVKARQDWGAKLERFGQEGACY